MVKHIPNSRITRDLAHYGQMEPVRFHALCGKVATKIGYSSDVDLCPECKALADGSWLEIVRARAQEVLRG